MSQPQANAYRPTPANPTADHAHRPAVAATVEHSDELLDEIDAILAEEERFAVNYHQRPGQ